MIIEWKSQDNKTLLIIPSNISVVVLQDNIHLVYTKSAGCFYVNETRKQIIEDLVKAELK